MILQVTGVFVNIFRNHKRLYRENSAWRNLHKLVCLLPT